MTSSTTTIEVLGARATAVPRGARIAGHLFARAAGWLLRAPAPAPIGAAGRAREAAQVRALAQQVQDTDPGFAADLYAAASRHESLAD